MTERRRFEVRDRDRTLVFDGELLATANSHRPSVRRWIVLELYRTSTGEFVLAGQGLSTLAGEVTRYWAHQCTEAEGVIEQLYMYDDRNTRYLTNVARQLLRDAGELDENIRRAFSVERLA